MDWLEGGMTVYALLINLLTVWNIWLLLTIFFGCDLRLTKRNMVVTASLFLIFDMGISLFFYSYGDRLATIQMLLIFVFIAAGAFCLAKEKRFKTFLFLLPALLLYMMYGTVLGMLDTLLELEEIGISYDGQMFPPFKILSDFFIFAILIYVLRKCKRQKWSLSLTIGEGIGILGFSLIFFALKTVFESLTELAGGPFYKKFGYIVLILMSLGILYAVIYRKLAGYYRNVSQHYKTQLEEGYLYFQTYRDKQQDMARFRHDWQNHVLVLQKMLQEGNYEKAEEYFKGLSGMTGTPGQTILTGNEMLDMLLCIKGAVCTEEEIRVFMEGTLSSLPAMHSLDSSILFSNLLDNAIEANRKVETGRFIRIRARNVNETVYLEMENPMQDALCYEGTEIITTKADSDAHGFGLKNVSEIVKKYHGQYHIDGKENRFTIQIIFPSPS